MLYPDIVEVIEEIAVATIPTKPKISRDMENVVDQAGQWNYREETVGGGVQWWSGSDQGDGCTD